MPLTDVQIRKAQPSDKDIWLSDQAGLRVLIKPNGSKYWRWKYRFGKKQKTLALGIYPEVSLKEAREAVLEGRRLLKDGVDPSEERRKRKAVTSDQDQFKSLAIEWWQHQKGTWTEKHAQRVLTRLEADVFDKIGDMDISKVKTKDLITLLRKVEARDALDVASRISQDLARIFRYGVQIGRLDTNPALDLKGVLKTRKVQHQPSLPREELPAFLSDLEEYASVGRLLTKLALDLLLFTFVRSGELREARWSEFDLNDRLWRIPADRMKMKTEHLVPLSTQAVDVLAQIKSISGQYDLVFPSERNRFKSMSDNTLRKAIFSMGYDGKTIGKSKAVPHGFRATASSILNEEGFNPDAIERQLSHTERNGVRAAYTHHARYMDDRREMMQWWADYLKGLVKQR